MPKLKAGDKAPDFELLDQNGESHKLTDYLGKWVLLYFYPKDDTPGCTKEACGIRDSFSQFKKSKIVVLGVSIDSVESHKKFAKKYSLPFSILSDKDKIVVKLYGVWRKKKLMGRQYVSTARVSFLINPIGTIENVYEEVKPEAHASEVLEYSRLK